MTETREQHLAWAKQRAHVYVAIGDPHGAVASMTSDMRKYEGTDGWDDQTISLRTMDAAMFVIPTGDPDALRRWVDGWN